MEIFPFGVITVEAEGRRQKSEIRISEEEGQRPLKLLKERFQLQSFQKICKNSSIHTLRHSIVASQLNPIPIIPTLPVIYLNGTGTNGIETDLSNEQT